MFASSEPVKALAWASSNLQSLCLCYHSGKNRSRFALAMACLNLRCIMNMKKPTMLLASSQQVDFHYGAKEPGIDSLELNSLALIP